MSSVETRLDGSTLVMRIPMRFQRRGGRKRIVAPDGSELTPSSKPQSDGTLVKALARASRWQRLLETGEHATLAKLADAERIAAPTYAASCGSRSSSLTSSNASWTGDRRLGWRNS